MRVWISIAISASSVLSSCKSVRSAHSDVKDVIVTSREGTQRVYFVENEKVKTALCPSTSEALDTEESLSNFRKTCKDEGSPGVSIDQFRTNMIDTFKKTYRADRLSTLELDALEGIITSIRQPEISTTSEARESAVDPESLEQIWAQFMPFAAGVKPTPFPPDADRSPVTGLVAGEIEVKVPASGAEFEFPAIAFDQDVNLFGLVANIAGQDLNCPASLRILSVTRMDGDLPVPVFGGEVVGGSRFLLSKSTQRVSSVRIWVQAQEALAETATLSCKVALYARPCDPLVMGYKVFIPDPVKMDARDLKMAELMAKPEVRAWHFLWHGIRNSWPVMSEEQKADIRTKLGLDWDAEKGGRGDATQRGEEFLHMHHMMLSALRQHLGKDMYAPWKEPPKPDDPNFPVPLAADPDMKTYMWGSYNRLMEWHKKAIDPKFVEKMSLSEYGSWLESYLHNTMHMTWAHPTQWYASYNPDFQDIMSNPAKYPAFVHPSNNSLAGTFTSHVNPFFYRLHGYIEERLQTWLDAHGYQTIADDCAGAPKCYQWKRSWDGKLPAAIESLTHQHGIDPAKIKELQSSTYRTIAIHSQMVPGKINP